MNYHRNSLKSSTLCVEVSAQNTIMICCGVAWPHWGGSSFKCRKESGRNGLKSFTWSAEVLA
jgi:hypothetical protein